MGSGVAINESVLRLSAGKHDSSCTETINAHAHAHTSTEAEINELIFLIMRLFYLEKAYNIQSFVHSGATIYRKRVISLLSYYSCEDLPAPPCYLVLALQNLLLNLNYNLASDSNSSN